MNRMIRRATSIGFTVLVLASSLTAATSASSLAGAGLDKSSASGVQEAPPPVSTVPGKAGAPGQRAPETPLGPVGSAFTYQGRLNDGGSPANGSYDLMFTLYDAGTGGNQVGSPVMVTNQAVTNGLFTLQLDFGGAAFQGSSRWLEIGVRPGGSGDPFTTLSPRQPLTATPYAASLLPGAVITGTANSTILTVDNGGSGTALYGLHSTTTGVEPGLKGETNSTDGYAAGVVGRVTNTSPGLFSTAVFGRNEGTGGLGIGVWGFQAGSGWGVFGQTGSGGIGVYGQTNSGTGVYGESGSGVGVYGTSSTNNAILGVVSNTLSAIAGQNTGTGYGVNGSTTNGIGVQGTSINYLGGRFTSNGNVGAWGQSNSWYGVYGQSGSGVGVYGTSTSNDAVRGVVSNTLSAVAGQNTGTGYGVNGSTTNGIGVQGTSINYLGGRFTSNGNVGAWGQSNSWFGVYGQSGSGVGIYGTSSTNDAVRGVVSNTLSGIAGQNTGTGYGVNGTSTGGTGGNFQSTNGDGVHGTASTGTGGSFLSYNGYGMFGQSTNNSGVYGTSTNGVGGYFTSTQSYAVEAQAHNDAPSVFATNSGSGIGVQGSTASGDGVYGISTTGRGVTGISGGGSAGVYGQSGSGNGVAGTSTGANMAGVTGTDAAGYGVIGTGVTGVLGTGSGTYDGVRGGNNSTDGTGIHGIANTGADAYGVWGESTGGYAGFFSGNVEVTGNLSKGGGSFKIDDPIDPANKYLYHSFVESPDMLDIYNGTATLDSNGEAWVQMPAYFEALNRSFHYQLTALDDAAPSLHIAQRMQNGRFKIGGGVPGMQVDWQVTGVRQDPYANAHRIPVEQAKPADEKGKYLYPTEYGQPASKGINYDREQQIQQQHP